jgi:MFS family permease
VEVFGSLPRAASALLWVRILNQLGAYALAFLAVLVGPDLVVSALTVFGVAALVSRWAGALLLDRLAPRTVITLGLGATGLAMAALAAARTPAQVMLAIALVGLAFEIYEPATQELLAQVTTGRQRQDAYVLLGSWLAAAGAVAGLLAAVLLPLGVRWLVVADATTCIAAATLAHLRLDRSPQRRDRIQPSDRRWRPPPVLLRVTLASTAFAVGYLAVMMFMPFVLLQRGAPTWLPGLTLTASAVLAPVMVQVTRRRLGWVSHRVALVAGTAVLGGLTLVMAGTQSVALVVSVYLGWAAVDAVLLGRWQALVADAAPEAERPRWFAFQGSSWGLATPAVPGLVGAVSLLAGGVATAALVTAGVAFLAVPLALGHTRGQ